MAYQTLEYFKVIYKKPFALIHCWRILKEAPKWQDLYLATKNSPAMGRSVIAASLTSRPPTTPRQQAGPSGKGGEPTLSWTPSVRPPTLPSRRHSRRCGPRRTP
ncbi:hypothetical protein BRADI_1g14493v3 [Brachypodium distachyon]|uniref:No apical meristem-associated C-terminal domain-containing protein n=1 Tax=Brachypodium distachyon TaxID=15368 RepID=A0A2K2DJG9_BRADI|nr:hypothetical protein BRADI_1g14493v3 [Brachypodium distachyon]